MDIKTPVRLNERNEIVDVNGNIVFPDVTAFRFNTSGKVNLDIDHVKKQRMIAIDVISLINRFDNEPEYESVEVGRKRKK